MPSRRTILTGGVAVAAAGFGVVSFLSGPDIEGGQYYTSNGIAIRGADPVAFFKDSKPVTGNAAHALEWSGATWYFANAENMADFARDPLAYAPQYGGYCAWAVAAKGELFSTQPANWAIVDGKLYLNFNDDVQATWNEDRPGFIAEGDRRWPDLRAQDG